MAPLGLNVLLRFFRSSVGDSSEFGEIDDGGWVIVEFDLIIHMHIIYGDFGVDVQQIDTQRTTDGLELRFSN
jgi:hypothetical protein